MEDLSIDELVSNLSTYKDQLKEVKRLLADDPGNSEYAGMKNELQERNFCTLQDKMRVLLVPVLVPPLFSQFVQMSNSILSLTTNSQSVRKSKPYGEKMESGTM